MVASYLHIFNPSILVMGGGVSQSSALFMNPFRAALKDTSSRANLSKACK